MRVNLRYLASLLFLLGFGAFLLYSAPASAAIGPDGKTITFDVSNAVTPVSSPALRTMAVAPPEPELAREVNPIQWLGGGVGLSGRDIGPDPLLGRGANAGNSPAPLVTFEGAPALSHVTPPDINGDVGPNHYIQMTNFSFQIWDKGDPDNGIPPSSLFGPMTAGAFFAPLGGGCQNNYGDPIVIYDDMADRWLLSQFNLSAVKGMCIAISQTPDPLGAYWMYNIPTPDFPDYPKLGVWSDGYYMGTNTGFPNQYFVHAFDRARMLAGLPATRQSVGGLANLMLPADVDGTAAPPADAPAIFYTFYHPDATGHPAGPERLAIYEFDVDWADPEYTTFNLVEELPIAPFNYTVCGFFANGCVQQPGTSRLLDDIAWWPMHRLQYRDFGDYAAMVGSFTVDADGADHAGIRWFEIRKTGSTYTLYQEGTHFPDTASRWMGSIAMDREGNIALGYSVSGSSVIPSIRYATRLAGDTPGTLNSEAAMWAGTGVQTGTHRWGDYSAMMVDPADGCTFWYTNEYHDANDAGFNWNTRIGIFRLEGCGAPDFSLSANPTGQAICTPNEALYAITIGKIQGFTGQVTLSAGGQPAGAVAKFSANPVTPPGSSTLMIRRTGSAAAGSYVIDVVGVAPTGTHTASVTLDVYKAAPGGAALVLPADEATGVPAVPTFTWNAVPWAVSYSIQVATDAGFENIVASADNLAGPTWVSDVELNTSTTYYWRVQAANTCGPGTFSSVFSFTTRIVPGDCAPGTIPDVLYSSDFEAGASGWTSSGTGNSWALSSSNPHSGASHYHGNDPAVVSDQRLISPPVFLPAGQNPVVLKFWHAPILETYGFTVCFDAGILEVTTDGGATWTQVPKANLLSGAYNGLVDTRYGNPLAGLQAWCGGDSYINTIADLSAYAGQTVQVRMRLGSDVSVGDEGWDLDDFSVRSCRSTGVGHDLDLAMDDGGVSITFGTTVEYTLSFTNTGLLDTTDVVLTSTVPAGAVFDPLHNPAGWACSNGGAPGDVCSFSYGSLDPGATGSVVFAVRPPAAQGGVPFVLAASAGIGDAEGDSAAATDTTPVENAVVHIANIRMEDLSTVHAYIVGMHFEVVNQFGVGVDGLTFLGDLVDQPDGNTGPFTRRTSKGGLANLTSRSQNPGLFTVCAVDVSGPGVNYDPAANFVTCGSLTLPTGGTE